MVFEFMVEQTDRGWVVQHRDRVLSAHARESAALMEADRQARSAHRKGEDARVLVRRSGRLFIERSYGRHPLVAPGSMHAVPA